MSTMRISIHTTASVVTCKFQLFGQQTVISIHTTASVVTEDTGMEPEEIKISIHTTASVVTDFRVERFQR